MAAPYQGDSYQGIIDAFNTVREGQGEKKYGYPANYRGIIEAILDLKKWGHAGDGEFPPGWNPEYDGDGNVIGGDYNPVPDNGTLWFDERQGRLFTWVDDGWYQTNGGDGLPHMGEAPPETEVPGAFWYNVNTDSLYLYNGNTWTIISTGAAGTNTATLMLADPTRNSFSANRPFLPDSIGLATQQDYNVWLHSALEKLEEEVDINSAKSNVYMGDIPPNDAGEGDLWYNTSRLQMLVRYDEAWVATSIPLVLENNFVELTNSVEANDNAAKQRHETAIRLIEQVASRPERRFSLSLDHNEEALQLIDSKGPGNTIKFTGGGGVSVDVTPEGINFDASALKSQIEALEGVVAEAADVTVLRARVSSSETKITELENQARVTPQQLSDLQAVVAQKAHVTDINSRLSVLGGHLQGALTMSGNKILDVGAPVNSGDAARKFDVDAVKSYVDSNFINKTLGVINGFRVNKSDITAAAFDFSQNASNAINALKFRSYGGVNETVTFGTTPNHWEYAWNYGSNEDFCWVHSTNGKQVSINKDGLTAKKLFVGNFQPNTANGTVVMNKIDVGATLQTIKSALQSSDSFAEFKAQVLASI